MESAGGMRLVNNADQTMVYTETGPEPPLRFRRRGDLVVRNECSREIVFAAADTLDAPTQAGLGPDLHDQRDFARGHDPVGMREAATSRS